MLWFWTICLIVILLVGATTAIIFRKNAGIFVVTIFITVGLSVIIGLVPLENEMSERNINMIQNMLYLMEVRY